MYNPEKLATSGTQDQEKQNKNNAICAGHQYTQTNTNNVNKTRFINNISFKKTYRPDYLICLF
jgi:hypothetical protein